MPSERKAFAEKTLWIVFLFSLLNFGGFFESLPYETWLTKSWANQLRILTFVWWWILAVPRAAYLMVLASPLPSRQDAAAAAAGVVVIVVVVAVAAVVVAVVGVDFVEVFNQELFSITDFDRLLFKTGNFESSIFGNAFGKPSPVTVLKSMQF